MVSKAVDDELNTQVFPVEFVPINARSDCKAVVPVFHHFKGGVELDKVCDVSLVVTRAVVP